MAYGVYMAAKKLKHYFEEQNKQTKQKETKQNKNNKLKRLVMRDSPCEDVLDSLATAPEKVLADSYINELVGEPQEEGMMSTAVSFPSVIEPRLSIQ